MIRLIITLYIILYIFTGDPYIKPIEYLDINIKNYTPINISECKQVMDSIDPKYFEGINYIIIQGESRHYLGLYWYWSKNIYLYNTCDRYVIVHELAHHCQYNRGDSFFTAKKHTGHFDECEDEIWAS